jgi:hypothetical protein
MIAKGKAKKGDGKDVAHKDNNPLNNNPKNIRMEKKKSNRSFKRTESSKESIMPTPTNKKTICKSKSRG